MVKKVKIFLLETLIRLPLFIWYFNFQIQVPTIDIPLNVSVNQSFTISITNLTNFTHIEFYYNNTKYNRINNSIISGSLVLFYYTLLYRLI